MPSQSDFLAAFFVGIVPALLILWYSLRRFSYPHTEYSLFDDRKVFFALAVGMVFGVFASVLNLSIGGELILLVGVLVVEESFKLVYLNRPGYRGRFDTTFYGVPLGAGAASTAVVASALSSGSGALFLPGPILLLALFSVSLSIVHVDTGALVGYGASRGEMWVPLGKAVLVRGLHTAFLVPFFLASGQPFEEAGPYAVLSVVTSIGFGLLVFLYVYGQLLPGTLPEDVRRKMKRERRRQLAIKE